PGCGRTFSFRCVEGRRLTMAFGRAGGGRRSRERAAAAVAGWLAVAGLAAGGATAAYAQDAGPARPEAFSPASSPPSPAGSPTVEQWSNTLMLDRLCMHQLLHNEEDRLFGMISLAVRATIRYEGGFMSGDLIDEAAQQSLSALLAACPQPA